MIESNSQATEVPESPTVARSRRKSAAAPSKPPRKPRQVRPKWTEEQWRKFIAEWQKAATFEDLCKFYAETSADELRARAKTARDNGVALKEFGKIDWTELQKLAPAPTNAEK